MSNSSHSTSLVGTRWVELCLAAFTLLIGAVVMFGSIEQGIGWATLVLSPAISLSISACCWPPPAWRTLC